MDAVQSLRSTTDTKTATSCPGKPAPPATHPGAGESHPASVSTVVSVVSEPTGHLTPAIPGYGSSAPPAPPASSVHVSPSSAAPPVGYSSHASGPATSVAPYPTSVITVVSSSRGPVGTGTGVIPPQNAT